MRATYEDLLRTARRHALAANQSAAADKTDLVTGWQATLTATRHHLRWLGLELSTNDLTVTAPVDVQGPLFTLATSIGAGGDLLALQNWSTSIAFDNEPALAVARARVASISLLGARAALTRARAIKGSRDPARRRLLKHLVDISGELEFLCYRTSADLGALGGLSTGLPAPALDDPSLVIRLAARWQSAHEATSKRNLLTRDLRSATAQLRTVCGYARHLTALLSASGRSTDSVHGLSAALRAANVAAMTVGHSWRARLSDVSGRSDGPAELAFVELLQALQGWLQDGARPRHADSIMADERGVAKVREVVDELVHSAHRVARVQQEAVSLLIAHGRLFVPRTELAKRDPEFAVHPTVWFLRYPQRYWVRTTRAGCFDELTFALAESAEQLSKAAEIAQRSAGMSRRSRPFGGEYAAAPRSVKKSAWRWYRGRATDLIPARYAEPLPADYAEPPGPER